MSTPLPTKEQAQQAHAFMVEQIHAPAFFEKLAANGLEPRNETEAQQLLQLGAVLAQKEAEVSEKQAQDGNPFLASALDALQPAQQRDVSVQVKQSADQLVTDSELAKTAALVYAHAISGGELADDEQPAEGQDTE